MSEQLLTSLTRVALDSSEQDTLKQEAAMELNVAPIAGKIMASKDMCLWVAAIALNIHRFPKDSAFNAGNLQRGRDVYFPYKTNPANEAFLKAYVDELNRVFNAHTDVVFEIPDTRAGCPVICHY